MILFRIDDTFILVTIKNGTGTKGILQSRRILFYLVPKVRIEKLRVKKDDVRTKEQ